MQYATMINSEHVAAQVKALREKSGLSVREMARRMGMSSSGYSHYETPARFKGPFLPMQVAQQMVDALAPEGVERKDVMALAGTSEAHSSRRLEEPDPSFGASLIPVYDVQASAGHGAVVNDEEHVSSLAFPVDYLRKLTRANPRDLKIITVKGDSMLPTLNDDDVVMLDTSKQDLSYDGLFVLRDNGDGLLVKRIGRATRSGFVSLISDNRDLYPTVERAIEDIQVIGKVLWQGRKV